MNSGILLLDRPQETPVSFRDERGTYQELVQRVASSNTFEKAPRLRGFFLHVCRCALENKPEEATEQQIGIHVYRRLPGYNPNEDNIVRSQARVLRMKLGHHFSNEGRAEPIVITIPKGRYLPAFEARCEQSTIALNNVAIPEKGAARRLRQILGLVGVLFGVSLIWLLYLLVGSRTGTSASSVVSDVSAARGEQNPADALTKRPRPALPPLGGEVRIAAGSAGSSYVDAWGRRWAADRYYQGGVSRPGPRHFFPQTVDAGLFRTMRQAVSGSRMVPESDREFYYDIPLHSGVYELRLFFADSLRDPDADAKEDSQNARHFQVNLNGRPLLADLDPITDAGPAAVDIRAFKDVAPAKDGKLHLDFVSLWETPAFVSAVELTPGIPGKIKPIRISAQPREFVDSDGHRWSGDNYFVEGRTYSYPNPPDGPKVPDLYSGERHGNFSYAIPVPPGSYTVKLHFLESYFSPLIPNATCRGTGCRVFDVSCNGVMLLQDFDIVQAAGGAFRPFVREFHGLHPNGQGKLLLSFSPKVNYAEVRAIEVIDEAE